MARFFELQSVRDENIYYINRDCLMGIVIVVKPDEDKEYEVQYEAPLGTISCYYDSLEEAKLEARKIAEGRICDEITEENACQLSPVEGE